MPEGPEISYMSYFFNNKYQKSILQNIIMQSGRYTRHPLPSTFNKLTNKLPSKIISIKNKGKFIYITLEDNLTLGIKLNYGHLVEYNEKHCHVKFETSKDTFYIDDLRNFFTLHSLTPEELNISLNKIGPDLIHDKISFSDYEQIMNKKSKMKIGIFLIDQKYFSGAGNYIRCEVCYESKISPFRLIGDLNEKEKEILFNNLIRICNKAYTLLIKSNKKYPKKVYQQKITPNGEIVISEKLEKNRNIYWCPSIQK